MQFPADQEGGGSDKDIVGQCDRPTCQAVLGEHGGTCPFVVLRGQHLARARACMVHLRQAVCACSLGPHGATRVGRAWQVLDRQPVEGRLLALHALQEGTVVPTLMSGLQALCKERPEDPVEWLANYLMTNNPKKKQAAAAAAPAVPAQAAGSS